MSKDMEVRRCSEQSGVFFDRDGRAFRQGHDPRNYHGRDVPAVTPRRELTCAERFTDSSWRSNDG